MKTPADRDLARHRKAIQQFLRRNIDSAPVRWALRVVEHQLFGWRAMYGFGHELWIESRFSALKAAGTENMEVLQRVLECYALRRDESDDTFPNANAFSAFLARKVLRLRRGVLLANSNAPRLIPCGREIECLLGRFAVASLMRLEKERVTAATVDRRLIEFAGGQ